MPECKPTFKLVFFGFVCMFLLLFFLCVQNDPSSDIFHGY